jgi:hypothetical protein
LRPFPFLIFFIVLLVYSIILLSVKLGVRILASLSLSGIVVVPEITQVDDLLRIILGESLGNCSSTSHCYVTRCFLILIKKV